MFYSLLGSQLDKWRSGDDVDPALVEEAIDDELPGRMGRIAQIAEKAPGEAFAEFVELTSFLNTAVDSRPSILGKITKHVEELRDALREIAQRLGVESFDLGVSVPVGLSVSVTFNVKRGE